MTTGAVILFDGECNLCNGAVDFVVQRDRHRHFRYASLQSDIGIRLLEKHGLDAGKLDTIVLIHGGNVYVRSTAALNIAQKLGKAWPLSGIFFLVPRFIRDYVYDWVAKNRYRWFGKRDTCRMPSPEERALFL
jgi:predicted DCC family thiol-disulfide oxidoreductase YuxK